MSKRRNTSKKTKRTSTSRSTAARKSAKINATTENKPPQQHRRKGIPTRAPSRDDPRKGIVFSFVTMPNLDTVVHVIRRPSDFTSVEHLPSSNATTSAQPMGTKLSYKEPAKTSEANYLSSGISHSQAVC
ncbi:hypothetical protein K7432_007013 [Basidiobolus ranarum]|uniref:Uncharacterized protein n=1 Tax=Basidiobolus ranarum TaxID=34480 RepID=A0ABR2WU14_9FUNG